MKRIVISGALLLAFAGCSAADRQFVVTSYEVALAPREGEVRLLDIQQGQALLEATCDVVEDAICGVEAAEYCASLPMVYDQQSYQTGAEGEARTVWLASCQSRPLSMVGTSNMLALKPAH